MNSHIPRERVKFRRRLHILWFKVLILGIFIGVVLGYTWHYKQVTESHRQEVRNLIRLVDYYRAHWTPIKQTETNK